MFSFKKLLYPLPLLLCAPLAQGAIAYVSASHTVCLQATASAGVACTLGAATTANNTVVVSISLKTSTRTLTNLVGSNAAAYFMQVTPVTPNGANEAIVMNICFNCPALTTVTPTLSGTSIYAISVEEYSGVSALGSWASATGTSTTPSVSITTIDSNNWIVAATSNLGNAGIPTAGTGNLRDANRTGTTSSFVAIAACDNTVASAGSVTCSDTITSGTWAAAAIELRTSSAAPSCSSPCPTLVQYAQWGSADGGSPESAQFIAYMPNATLANNLLVCGTGFDNTDGGHASAFSSFTIDGTAFTAGPTSNDGTRVFALYYIKGIAAGKQKLDFELTATTFNVQLWCAEFYNVDTSAAPDGTSTSASGLTGPLLQPGSITTTVNNDLILVAGLNDSTLSAANYTASYDPAVAAGKGSNSLTMLGDTRRFGPFAFFINQATAAAINPAMYVDQATKDTWAIGAIAFKAASAGTAPPVAGSGPSGMRIVREIVEIPNSTTYRIDLPCSGNLMVATQPNITSAGHITAITDANNNTYSLMGGTTLTGTILHADNAGCSNANYRQATVTLNSVGSPGPTHFYDVVGAATSPLDTSITTSTSGATASSGLVDSGAQTQGAKAASATVCTSNVSVDTTVNFTPSTAGGIAFVVEQNGQGPECGVSGTAGSVLDAAWFGGEDDACCGTLDSSSGFGHLPYSSATQQIWTFNWSNSLAASASGYDMILAAFKSPAGAVTKTCTLSLMGAGPC
jgi:hypothetical protein